MIDKDYYDAYELHAIAAIGEAIRIIAIERSDGRKHDMDDLLVEIRNDITFMLVEKTRKYYKKNKKK